MKVHLQVDGAPANAGDSAREIAESGADRLFTFDMVAVARTEAALARAIDGVASLIAFYGSTPNYLPVLEVEGWADLQPKLNQLSKQGTYAEMRALITEPMVRTYGIVGTPDECAAQVQNRYGAYASDVCCYFPGYTPARVDVADLVTALHGIPAPGSPS